MHCDKAQPDLARIRLAQKLAGELLWIATKTRPDLVCVTSRIGQMVTRNVEFAIQLAHNVLRYLRPTAHYEIIYDGAPLGGKTVDVGPLQDRTAALEAYADASFAPGNDRSQTGIVLVWNQAPITWLSMRQPCASLSTAEAELQSSIDALALTEGFLPLIQELETGQIKTFLYNDNQGAVTVMKVPQGSWRTRHLRLKAAWFFEQLESSKYAVFHLPGKYMLGDICTKSLQGPRLRELLQMMGLNLVDRVEGESAEIKNLNVGSGGASTKRSGPALSESTSGLGNLGADSGGAGIDRVELIDTSLETVAGEDAASNPMIPNVSLLKRGLKVLVAALRLKRSAGKVVITIDDPEPDNGQVAWLVALMSLLGVVILCCGMMLGRYGRTCDADSPRIQSMRADEMRRSDEWTVVSSAELRSRDRTPSPTSDEPPSIVENPDLGSTLTLVLREHCQKLRALRSEVLPRPKVQLVSPKGPIFKADPAPYDSRYPVPRTPDMTLSAPAEQRPREEGEANAEVQD